MAPDHLQMAREYLARTFQAAGGAQLVELAQFDESPLEGEGPVSVLGFEAAAGGRPESYRVVVGQTEPNYYPAWGLDPDEIYSLHIGTRFMLVVQVAPAPLTEAPPDLESRAVDLLGQVAPGEPVIGFHTVAAFKVDDQTHFIARCRIGPEDVYLILGDLPAGIYRRVDLAPQVVYRLHLGKLIRMEPDDGA